MLTQNDSSIDYTICMFILWMLREKFFQAKYGQILWCCDRRVKTWTKFSPAFWCAHFSGKRKTRHTKSLLRTAPFFWDFSTTATVKVSFFTLMRSSRTTQLGILNLDWGNALIKQSLYFQFSHDPIKKKLLLYEKLFAIEIMSFWRDFMAFKFRFPVPSYSTVNIPNLEY